MSKRPSRKKKLLRAVGIPFTLALFCGALWILHDQIRKYGLHRIARTLLSYSPGTLALAACLTALFYGVMTGYDQLGFRYIRRKIALHRVAFSSFIAAVFSTNIGLANFAGAAVRYRIYRDWGIRRSSITQVIALDVLSNWLGFLTMAAAFFTFDPPPIPGGAHLPISSAQPLGFAALGLLCVYVAAGAIKRKPFRIRKWKVPVPTSPVFIGQVLVACLDFGLGGLPLYALLPSSPDLSYWNFLGIYLFAQITSIVSHVPGGLGILETMVLLSLAPRIFTGDQVLAALIAYRAIFFLVPFVLASVMFGGFELRAHAFKRRSGARSAPHSAH